MWGCGCHLPHRQSPLLTVLEKKGGTGWSMKVELQSTNSIATCKFRSGWERGRDMDGGKCVVSCAAMRVSLAPSSSPSCPLVKELQLLVEGDTFKPGQVTCLSDPSVAMVWCAESTCIFLLLTVLVPLILLQDDISGYTLPANSYSVSNTTWCGDQFRPRC